MKFDHEYFDAGLYRMGTRCEKWDEARKEHGDVLPLWVADMDFPSPPAVQEAILRRAGHPTFGYTGVEADDYQAVIDFWQRRHGLAIEADWLTLMPCVVTGIKLAILALTQPGDGVIIQSPVYGPFRFSVAATGRTLLDAPMTRQANGRYDMDLSAVLRCEELVLLSSAENGSPVYLKSRDNRSFYVTGHPEYERERLAFEYQRDSSKCKDWNIQVPQNYFPNDDPARQPHDRWIAPGQQMFRNWLRFYVDPKTAINR